MYKISEVHIEGFWGSESVSASINNDVSIFIGPNGSGKSTLINILQGILTLDLKLLQKYYFDSVKIILTQGSSVKTLNVVRKAGDSFYDLLEYRISRDPACHIPLVDVSADPRRRRVGSRYQEDIDKIKCRLNEIAKISWLSVHREAFEEEEYSYHASRPVRQSLNPIDTRLNKLLQQLAEYQRTLQAEVNKLSSQFQKSVLGLILYNTAYDTFDLEAEKSIDFDALETQLMHAYDDVLGGLSDSLKTRINNHITQIKGSIENALSEDPKLTVNNVLPISLYKRTRKITNLSVATDNKKKAVFEHLNLFVEIINSFLDGKKVEVSALSEHGMIIVKEGRSIDFSYLSSGEKQLFILLSEALLQKKSNAIFIADEPELSLHISWQKKLLTAIRELNENAQLIVATHSPEIAGPWEDKLLKMKGVFNATLV